MHWEYIIWGVTLHPHTTLAGVGRDVPFGAPMAENVMTGKSWRGGKPLEKLRPEC